MKNISYGAKAPAIVNVIIEIPAMSSPIKYEVDKDSGMLSVDRFISSPMHYPANYGYVPKTLAKDGDPVDMLVITPYPINYGAIITARPIGMLQMEDEAGEDNKIIAVPDRKLTSLYDEINSCADLPEILLRQIEHFFNHYKELDSNKWVKLGAWSDAQSAQAYINETIAAYNGK